MAVRFLLRRADFVWIREQCTYDLLRRLGVPAEHLEVAPDLAFALPAAPLETVWARERLDPDSIARPWTAISPSSLAVRLGGRGNAYIEAMVRLCTHLHGRYGGSVFLVPHEVTPPHHGPDDRTVARAIKRLCGSPRWLYPLEEDHGPSVLKGLIGSCDAVVAARMHAAIAGLSLGIPTIAVAWSHKYRGLMQDVGLGQYLWDQGKDSPEALCKLYDSLWHHRSSVKTQLDNYTTSARLRISEIVARIACHIERVPISAAAA
jgi:polysaccharide pyruvyl transferase WcaK-like protein